MFVLVHRRKRKAAGQTNPAPNLERTCNNTIIIIIIIK